jgi:hypothetical protein
MKRIMNFLFVWLTFCTPTWALERAPGLDQTITVFAFDSSTGAPKTGDASNITLYYSLDGGSPTVLSTGSGHPAELDATNMKGWYSATIISSETDGKEVTIAGRSSVSSVVVVGKAYTTVPPNASKAAIDSSGRTQIQYGTSTGQISASSGVAKVDVDTIKTNPVVNGGTITFPSNSTLGTSTLTQSQVTGGAYALNSSSFAFGSGAIPAAAVSASAALKIADADKQLILSTTSSADSDLGTTLTLTSNPSVDIAGSLVVLTDVSSGQSHRCLATGYNVLASTLTINAAPFNVDVGDEVRVYATPKQLPSALAGEANGLFIAGTNAQTTVTSGFGSGTITATSVADDTIDSGTIASNAIGNAEIANDAITANKIHSDVTTELQNGLATQSSVNSIDGIVDNIFTAFEVDGGVYRLTTNALEQLATDWSVTEKNQIRHRLGLDGTTSTPSASPSLGTVNANVTSMANNVMTASAADSTLGTELGNANWATTTRTLSGDVNDFDELLDGAPTFADAMDEHGYTTGRAEKIDRLAPSLLLSTTVEVAASQTSLELDEGPTEDDVFNGSLVIITDASEPAIKAVALIKDYDGDTKTITLVTDPEIFTITAEDSVDVIATGSPAALWLGSSP